MTLTQQWKVDFNNASNVAKWFYMPASLDSNPANVRFVDAGSEQFAEIVFGRTSAAERTVGGVLQKAAFTTKTALDADLNWNAGSIAFCFDSDPVKHGSYQKSGASGTGNWSRIGSVDDRAWNDQNHTRVAWLELLMQSWWYPGDPGAVTGKIGWAVTSPAITDLRGAEIRWEMRAQNLVLGENVKIVQHMQTHVSSQQLWPDPGTQRAFVNALQIANPISDQLMMGTSGYYGANPVRGVHDSGWRTVTIPLNPSPEEWLQLGGLEGRQGLWDDPVRYYNYVVSPPSEFLANFTGNAYMVAAHKVVDAATKANPPSDDNKIRGTLQFKSVSIWK